MEWHSTQRLLPKRDSGYGGFSVDVLTYSDEGFHVGYYRYCENVWVMHDLGGNDMLKDYDDFDHSAVMWMYIPEAPKPVTVSSTKIDGE